jgi:mycothiol synthase
MSIATRESLDADERAAVRALAGRIERRDGAPPLSDQTLGHLASGHGASGHRTGGQVASGQVRHLLAYDLVAGAEQLIGYAQLYRALLEVAAEPAALDGLLDAAEAESLELEPGTPQLLLWAHGTRSLLGAAADTRGYVRHRVLWQMRRQPAQVPEVAVPDAVTIRAFVPGQDEQAWLRVNAAAFADHAEQGRMSLADLHARESENWFDPTGFFLAERDAGPTDKPAGPTDRRSGPELLGFHWTKVHDDGTGEVYILGVSPAAQGIRLGPALLAAGLRHLGDREILLYVDESNTGAKRLYQRFGFADYDLDVQYRYSPFK